VSLVIPEAGDPGLGATCAWTKCLASLVVLPRSVLGPARAVQRGPWHRELDDDAASGCAPELI
jgi:hypothetical protein